MSAPPALKILAGISVEAALAEFCRGCNYVPERLWVTESWIEPRFAELRELLSDPVTEAEAESLREAVLKRRRLDDVIEWLEHKPLSWQEYLDLRNRRATKGWRGFRERGGFFPWEDVEACRANGDSGMGGPAVLVISEEVRTPEEAKRVYVSSAVPCSSCGAPPEELTWIHFTSPRWTWELMCGRAGWLTVCDRCHLQVDFFGEAMN